VRHSHESQQLSHVQQQLTKTVYGHHQTTTLSRSISFCGQKPNLSRESVSDSSSLASEPGPSVSKKLDMQHSDAKTMLPHDIYREHAQSE
jgi:hypothetical protein